MQPEQADRQCPLGCAFRRDPSTDSVCCQTCSALCPFDKLTLQGSVSVPPPGSPPLPVHCLGIPPSQGHKELWPTKPGCPLQPHRRPSSLWIQNVARALPSPLPHTCPPLSACPALVPPLPQVSPTHHTPEGLSAPSQAAVPPFSNQSTLLFKHNYAGTAIGLFTTFTNTRGGHNVPNTVRDAVWGTRSARDWDPRSAEPTNREHLRDAPLESDADRGRTGRGVVTGQVLALGKAREHGKYAR